MASWAWTGEQWVASFVWGCGADGSLSTQLDPFNGSARDRASLDSVLARCQRGDCTDCRQTDMNNKPIPEGHHPHFTHQPQEAVLDG